MASGGDVGSSADNTSHRLFDYTCSLCSKNGKSTTASHYCPDCDTCYCKACLCDHNVIGRADIRSWGKPRSTHSVEDSSQMAEETATVWLKKCLHHPEIDVEFYCEDHDVVCCNRCSSTYHRQCTKKEDIESIFDYINLEDDKRFNKTTMDTLTETLRYAQTENKLRAISTETSHRKYIEHVEIFREKMHEVFDKILDASFTKKKHILSKIETDSVVCQAIIPDVTKFKEMMQKETDADMSYFIFTKMCKEWLIKNEQVLKDIRSVDIKDRESFEVIPDRDIESTLTTLTKLGKIKLGLARFSVKMDDDDNPCEINSACQLTDGRTLLCDTANKRLKVLDDSLTIVNSYEFTNTPRGMCVINDTDVAVKMVNQTVEIVHVTENFESLRTLKLNTDCLDLAFANNMIYKAAVNECESLTSCKCSIKISKYNANTNVLEGVYRVNHKLRHRYYSTGSLHLRFNAEGSRMYISSTWFQYLGLLVCDNEGKEIGLTCTYNSSACTGMYCKDSDIVYLCSSNKVYRCMLKDGSNINYKEIVSTSDGIPSPLSIAWNKSAGRVMIGGKCDYLYMV